VVSIIVAIFGFGGVAAASAGIARILFFLFLILFVASLLAGLIPRARWRGRTERPAGHSQQASDFHICKKHSGLMNQFEGETF
jgi:uncharacterized membrane protein YtjA (UPF0391 family)